jgi:rubrerythrin
MATDKEYEFYEDLESLLQLDFDAIEAYEAAINRIDNQSYKSRLREFKEDHQNHIKDTAPFLKKVGHTPPSGPGVKSLLTQGKVVLANIIGDAGILKAMRSNEEETNRAYEKINSYEDLPADLKKILQKGLADERKHKNWIEKELENLK